MKDTITVTQVPIRWNPALPVFASEPFLRATGDEYGWLGGIDAAGGMRCVLPYTIVRQAGIRMVRFRVETIPLDTGFPVEQERMFLNGVVQHFRDAGADVIIPPTTNSIFRCFPDGAKAAPYGTYALDLGRPEEEVWSSIQARNRTTIRSAGRKGVEICHGPEFAGETFAQVRDTFKRSGLPFMSREAFDRMIEGAGDQVKIFVAKHEGRIHGSAVNFFSQHTAYSMYEGSAPDALGGATKLMHWEAMRFFKSLGVGRYDFCGARVDPEKGSKQETLAMFKRQMGGLFERGYLWKYVLRPIRGSVYSWAIRWKRGGDLVDQEGHKLNSSSQETAR